MNQLEILKSNSISNAAIIGGHVGSQLGKKNTNHTLGEFLGHITGTIGATLLALYIPAENNIEKEKRKTQLKEEIATTKQQIQFIEKNHKLKTNKQVVLNTPVLSTQSLRQVQTNTSNTKSLWGNLHENSQVIKTSKTVNPDKNIMTSLELTEKEFDCIEFNGEWLILFGRPELNFYLLIYGMPGSGKSTFAIKFANYLGSNFGTVLYISGEEGFSKTFADKFKRLGAFSKDLMVADLRSYEEIEAELKKNPYNFFIIDSLNTLKMGSEEMKKLRQLFPQSAFITISQSTKNGQMRGSNELIHDCDIEVRVEDGKAVTIKNRFLQAGKEFDVF